MKFKIMKEGFDPFEPLNEEKTYKIDLNDGTGDYFYFIGGNKADIKTDTQLFSYLKRQLDVGHEKLSDNIDELFRRIPHTGFTITDVSDDNNAQNEFDRFLNYTHSTARKHAPQVIVGKRVIPTLRHHMNWIETDNSYENILAIDMREPYEAIHELIHNIPFTDLNKKSDKKYTVYVFDDTGKLHKKKLLITMKLLNK